MTLQERLANDLREALRRREALRLSTLRLMRSGLQNEEIARGKALNDEEIAEVLGRQAKQRRDSIDQFSKGGRQDLVEKEEAELAVLMGYLPQQLSREEIVAAAREIIQATGARGPADRGKVMGRLMPRLRGRADGRDVNQVVTELLQG